MFTQFAQAGMETAFNYLLRRSPEVMPLLAKLKGKVLRIKLQQYNLQCYLLFSSQKVDVLGQYEGDVDCDVALSSHLLFTVPQKSELSQYINDKSIILNGDLQLLQDFVSLLERVEKDPALLLAPYLGDVVAYSAVNLCQKLANKTKQRINLSQQYWGERLTEEWQLLSPRLAVADFNEEVKKLEKQTALLEQRITALLYETQTN